MVEHDNVDLVLELVANGTLAQKSISIALEEASRRGKTEIVEKLYRKVSAAEIGDSVMAAVVGSDANAPVLDVLMHRKGEISFIKLKSINLVALAKLSAATRKKHFS